MNVTLTHAALEDLRSIRATADSAPLSRYPARWRVSG